MRVRVYKNLHKNCYSVKAMEGSMKGLVIAHCDNIVLRDVRYLVYQKGRERVLREKCKNVHAYVEGNIVSIVPINKSKFSIPLYTDLPFKDTLPVTYNPYKYDSFVFTDGETAINNSNYVILNSQGIHVPLRHIDHE